LESVFAVPATVDELRMRSEDLDQIRADFGRIPIPTPEKKAIRDALVKKRIDLWW